MDLHTGPMPRSRPAGDPDSGSAVNPSTALYLFCVCVGLLAASHWLEDARPVTLFVIAALIAAAPTERWQINCCWRPKEKKKHLVFALVLILITLSL